LIDALQLDVPDSSFAGEGLIDSIPFFDTTGAFE